MRAILYDVIIRTRDCVVCAALASQQFDFTATKTRDAKADDATRCRTLAMKGLIQTCTQVLNVHSVH